MKKETSMVQRTLLNIKPDAVSKNIIGEIIRRVEEKGYRIVAIDKLHLSREEAEDFYSIHRNESFFEPLINFMISGPCVPMIVEGIDAVAGVRELVGATDRDVAAEGTIRRDFATTVRHNAVHASDAVETAKEEIEFFFGRRKQLL